MVDSLIGQVLEERYLVETELGRGAMGVVYRARHVRLGRAVAIKVLHQQLVGNPKMLERFEREAVIAARLNHLNLVSVLDVGRTASGDHFLVMELANGSVLSTVIGGGPIPPSHVIDLAIQLLQGLEHAHDAGLIHRDLKPDNIIIELDRVGAAIPRIVDFGIAVLHDRGCARNNFADDWDRARLTKIGHVAGTPAYMSPEQATGQEIDPTTDLFALGVIMYEMLSGVLPFDEVCNVERVVRTMTQRPTFAARANIVVPELLETFVQTMMAGHREHRFPTARSARAALTALAARRIAAPEVSYHPNPPAHNVRTRTKRSVLAPATLEPARLAVGTFPPRQLTTEREAIVFASDERAIVHDERAIENATDQAHAKSVVDRSRPDS